MQLFRTWWLNDLPKGVKLVILVLMANALPAIIILMTIPTRTETFFVWTINPTINARLIGVMYANALILIGFGIAQINWPRVRIIMVVITLFSILATILTFFYLKPFLAHPWFHLAYWLSMYLILFFAAPYVFIKQEKADGGRLPIHMPLDIKARALLVGMIAISFTASIALLFQIENLNQVLPWTLPPLVGGLIGVLFITHTAAYAWALWDGDWVRIRPIIWQIPITGLLFILLPLLHPADLKPDSAGSLAQYLGLFSLIVIVSVTVIINYRAVENEAPSYAK